MTRGFARRSPVPSGTARPSLARFARSLLVAQALVVGACATAGPAALPALDPVEERGRTVFKTYCARCHSASGDGVVVGPSLAGIAERAGTRVEGLDAEAYIRQSILEPERFTVEGFPTGLMPEGLLDDIEPEEIDELVAYLLTLR